MRVSAWACICVAFLSLACNVRDGSRSAPASTPKKEIDWQAADRLFRKKLECEKFLERIEGSQFGPKPRYEKGLLRLNPIVFYSPKLNTCLFLDRYNFFGETVVTPKREYKRQHASVEDLLTGLSIEERDFDFTLPADAEAEKNFEAQTLSKYGPEASGNWWNQVPGAVPVPRKDQ
jgi:hypothetical protein